MLSSTLIKLSQDLCAIKMIKQKDLSVLGSRRVNHEVIHLVLQALIYLQDFKYRAQQEYKLHGQLEMHKKYFTFVVALVIIINVHNP